MDVVNRLTWPGAPRAPPGTSQRGWDGGTPPVGAAGRDLPQATLVEDPGRPSRTRVRFPPPPPSFGYSFSPFPTTDWITSLCRPAAADMPFFTAPTASADTSPAASSAVSAAPLATSPTFFPTRPAASTAP